MSMLKANKLESRFDVIQRGAFRIVWVTIPGTIAAYVASLLGYKQLLSVYFLAVIIAVPVLGVLIDAIRLKTKGTSNN